MEAVFIFLSPTANHQYPAIVVGYGKYYFCWPAFGRQCSGGGGGILSNIIFSTVICDWFGSRRKRINWASVGRKKY